MPGFWKLLNGRWGSGDGETDEVRIDASTNSIQTIEYEHHEIHSNSHYFMEDFTTLGSAVVLDFGFTTANNAHWSHLVFAYESTLKLQVDIYELADFDMDGTVAPQRGNNRAKCFSGKHTPAGSSATVLTDSAAAFTVDALIDWKIHNITDASYGVITDNDATTVTVAELTGGTDNDWDQNDFYEINQSLSIIQSGPTINDVGLRIGGSNGGSGTKAKEGQTGGSTRNKELVLRQDTNYLFRFTSGAADNDFSYSAEWYEHADKH